MTSSRLLTLGSLILLVASFAAAQVPPLTITTTSPLPSGVVGAPYFQTLSATGGYQPYIGWEMAAGSLPPGIGLSGSGIISGTTSAAGVYSFTVRLWDAREASTTKAFTLAIASGGTTQGPDGEVGVLYRATLVALAGTPPLTWSITSGQLPPGLTLNSGTGVISGTPTTAGTFGFVAQWRDSDGVTFPNTFSIRIYPALAITTASPLPGGILGVAYSQQIAVGGGKPPYSASIIGSLPAGLAFDPEALVIRGTPTALGTFAFGVTVSDSLQAAVTKPFSITVTTVTITTASPWPDGTVGTAYSLILTAAGGAPPYGNWRVVEGALPSGLTLDASKGVLSGTPRTAGTGFAQVSVDDSGAQSATRVFNWTVNPATLTITTASPLPGASAGSAYSQTFAATGGTPQYSWSVASGSLPPGLGLGTSGILSGAPTQSGTFTFTVTVTDSARATASKQFLLTVNPATLTITTASPLPGAFAGSAYSQTFAAMGGTPQYNWSVASGSLPPGLGLGTSGILSGTPAQAGAYNFTVRVTDSRQTSATKDFAVTVSVPQAPTLSVTGLTDIVNPAQQPSLDVQLSSTYALAVTGTVTLTFTPDAVAPTNDPSIQFSSGGRTLSFTIPAGQTRAFPASPPAIQTGTVAGRIDLTLQFSAGGQDITPSPAPVRSVQIARSAPTITSVKVVNKTSSGFTVRVTGYSTPRQVTQAVFAFAPSSGGNLGTTQLTVPVDAAFTTWFTGTASGQFGSSFLYSQPFQVQGALTDIASVSVTLSNSTGTSQPVSASF